MREPKKVLQTRVLDRINSKNDPNALFCRLKKFILSKTRVLSSLCPPPPLLGRAYLIGPPTTDGIMGYLIKFFSGGGTLSYQTPKDR